MPISPTAEGFRAAFRRPALTLGEITWRWVVGATATLLFFFGLIEYLSTLPVTNGELLFLRTRQPYLVAQAILHILRGSLNRAVMSLLLAALMLGLLWIIAASLGRAATVAAMLEYFRERLTKLGSGAGIALDGEKDVASNVSTESPFRTLLRLNFLRVALTVAAIVGLLGAAILAGFASPDKHARPGLVFVLFLPLAGLVCVVWSGLNWLLSLAGMFAVRDRDDAVGAISSAVALCRERTAAVFAVSSWTGLAHLVAFVGATTVVSMPMGLAGLLPWRLVALAMLLVTLAYLAVADWLYMARLAGYVCIVEMPEALAAAIPPVIAPPNNGSPVCAQPPLQTAIDRDEPILSDLSNACAEA
ncbi:MAG TPA: hypothetical protein VE377_20490 [Candidatus Dormibacteraeota bacterium]|nr:hypothetical protein [Candidatus Dormibacteraeota bacterium]